MIYIYIYDIHIYIYIYITMVAAQAQFLGKNPKPTEGLTEMQWRSR